MGESGNRPSNGDSSSRACDLNVADVGCSCSGAICYGTSLRRRRWLCKDRNIIRAVYGDGGLKGEWVARDDRKVIAAIVLQDKTCTQQADDGTSDGKGSRGTGDLDVGNIGCGCAREVGHRAGLRRGGRRGRNRNIITLSANDCRFERERAVSCDRKIVDGVVLYDEPSAASGQAGDHPADSEGARAGAGAGAGIRARARPPQVAAHEKRRCH